MKPVLAFVEDLSRAFADHFLLYWSLLAYFVVLAPISGWGAWHATWGGPWLDLWLAVGCVIVASVTGGFVIGRFWRSRIAPLIAVVVAFVIAGRRTTMAARAAVRGAAVSGEAAP